MKLALLALVIAFAAPNALSAVKIWDGGGADANWLTAANWDADTAPVPNDDLVFPSIAAQFATNNNFPSLANFNSISIDGSYTISGSQFRVGAGGLTVTSGTPAINAFMNLSAAATFAASAGTTTTIAAVFVNSPLRIDGAGSFGIGLLSGPSGVNKVGSGASLIVGSALFSGSIFIGDGILVIDATMSSNAVTVEAPNGGLGGTGRVGQVNVMSGSISAGTLTSPTGILSTGNLNLTVNSNYVCKIGGTSPGANGYDQLFVTGTVTLSNARLGPIPWNAFRPAIGDAFTIIRNDGTDAINGTFLNAPEGAVFSGPLNTAFRITYHGGDGNDVVITRVARAMFDFDGDGRTDISAFHPSDATWNILPSGGGANPATHWGLATDAIAPADYDGDNRTDLAVFRPSEGVWYILNSFTSTATILQFGLSGDLPRPNDFDGDGRADIAVFRQSNGVWYQVRSLTNQTFAQQFGLTGDLPQMVDFDGDGMGDLSVYRPSDGTWHFWQSSTNSYFAFPFGTSTDTPVPADYNGDGRTDAAVFRATADPNQPDFYILLSGPFTQSGASWGVPGDLPVIGDYDGDGHADVSVFRPSTNTWYLLRSTAGFTSVAFGSTGDRVIPAAFTSVSFAARTER
jgi:hypothetical protein